MALCTAASTRRGVIDGRLEDPPRPHVRRNRDQDARADAERDAQHQRQRPASRPTASATRRAPSAQDIRQHERHHQRQAGADVDRHQHAVPAAARDGAQHERADRLLLRLPDEHRRGTMRDDSADEHGSRRARRRLDRAGEQALVAERVDRHRDREREHRRRPRRAQRQRRHHRARRAGDELVEAEEPCRRRTAGPDRSEVAAHEGRRR